MIYHQPMYNNLSDRMNGSGDTETLLLVEPNLFAELHLPDGLDAELVINTILTIHGHAPLDHFDPGYMRRAIGVWSRRRKPIWEKLIKTTQFEYDPISNYDRKEEYQDTHYSKNTKENDVTTQTNTTNDNTNTVKGTVGVSGNAENRVSADNSPVYSPESEKTNSSLENTNSTTTDSGKNSGTGTRKEKDTDEHDEKITHNAHFYGNIGVTTTQDMIAQERRSVDYSVEEVIADDYRERFCLDFY